MCDVETVGPGITVNIDVDVCLGSGLTQGWVTNDHYGFDGVNGPIPHNTRGIESVNFESRLLGSRFWVRGLHAAVCAQD